MKIGVMLFQYFPHGGLQRDCLAISRLLRQRGNEVRIFAGAWRGQRPEGIGVEVLPVRGWTNHGRAAAFARAAGRATAGDGFDAVVGFNRMPGLDVYYACDTCLAAQARARHGWLYRLTP